MLYDHLMNCWITGRQQFLEHIPRFMAQEQYFQACGNYAEAATDAIMAGETEWRLGSGDPTRHFIAAIDSSRDALELLHHRTDPGSRSEIMVTLWDTIYLRYLVDQPIEPELRAACFVPQSEWRAGGMSWLHVFDTINFQMILDGEPPPEFEEFIEWLEGMRGTRNHMATIRTYRDLIRSAQNNDAGAAAKAVREAEKNFQKRNPNLPVTSRVTVTCGFGMK